MTKRKILFRCDGGELDGMGHVMRCLAVARKLKEFGCEVNFVSSSHPGVETIRKNDFHVSKVSAVAGSDTREVLAIIEKEKPSCFVVDSKRPLFEYIEAMSKASPVALIDDELLRDWDVDVLINPNPWASVEAHYPRALPSRKILVGPKFNMIRDEYFHLSEPSEQLRRILITFGGEDPQNHTLKTLEALQEQLLLFDVTVIIGPAHPDAASIKNFVAKKRLPFRILENVSEMWRYIGLCDSAITACGTTAWELWAAGRSQLGVVIEEHQRIVADTLTQWDAMQLIGNPDGILVDKARTILAQWSRENYPVPGSARRISESGISNVALALAQI